MMSANSSKLQGMDELLASLLGAGQNSSAAPKMPSGPMPGSPQMYSAGNAPTQPPIQPVSSDPVVPPSDTEAASPMPAPPGSRIPASDRELQNLLRGKIAAGQDSQKQSIDVQNQLLMNQLSRSQGIDLSPGFEIVKAIGGDKNFHNAGSSYTAPPDQENMDQKLMAELAKQKQALSTNETTDLKDELNNRQNMQYQQMMRQNLMQQRLDENVYGKAVTKIQSDPILNKMVVASNNVNRTVGTMLDPKQEMSISNLHDLMQTVTGALTSLPGGGTGGERSSRLVSTLANDLQTLEQKFGNLNSVPKNDPTLIHFISLAKEGQQFLSDQADQRLKFLSVGHENITNKPTYAPQFKSVQDELRSQFKPTAQLQNAGYVQNNGAQPGGGADSAVAAPPKMSEEEFIQAYLKAKNGR